MKWALPRWSALFLMWPTMIGEGEPVPSGPETLYQACSGRLSASGFSNYGGAGIGRGGATSVHN
jgi:hypothetical protein